jgi:hypothetical protein
MATGLVAISVFVPSFAEAPETGFQNRICGPACILRL